MLDLGIFLLDFGSGFLCAVLFYFSKTHVLNERLQGLNDAEKDHQQALQSLQRESLEKQTSVSTLEWEIVHLKNNADRIIREKQDVLVELRFHKSEVIRLTEKLEKSRGQNEDLVRNLRKKRGAKRAAKIIARAKEGNSMEL